MDQAVGLRQKEIQVLQIKREIILGWKSCIETEQRVFFVSRWVVFSDRGVLPRENSGVFAQVQVQEGVGVFVAGAQSLRERHHS